MSEVKTTPIAPTSVIVGHNAESKACQFLLKKGLKFIERNYRCKSGEIDLIMNDKGTLVFVEVRYRKNSQHGSGAETVTYFKQKKLIRSATHYMLERYKTVDVSCRIDVVSIGANDKNIEWIKNAIEQYY